MSRVRCAIYTRKSSDEGLEQEFNSLDAQYESCKAYILSQKHEGWTVARERYDDGGFSGGSMERPGLKALLAACTWRISTATTRRLLCSMRHLNRPPALPLSDQPPTRSKATFNICSIPNSKARNLQRSW